MEAVRGWVWIFSGIAQCKNTVYFNNQARGNSRISRTEFVYDEREHAMANVYLYLNFLLRICS